MKEDVGIVITNNYNIAVKFDYCPSGQQNEIPLVEDLAKIMNDMITSLL